MKSNAPRGLYVHVPFCLRKCAYCDFHSVPGTAEAKAAYIVTLNREVGLKGSIFPGQADTVFFGGGTPSCLSAAQIAMVLKECGRYFTLCADAEVSMEINPGTMNATGLTALRAHGINRLSIGLQAAQDRLLIVLGRSHDFVQFRSMFDAARGAGFDNISVDVMYGLPGQAPADYLETLEHLIRLEVNHISAYGLQIERDTPLALDIKRGLLVAPDEGLAVEMYNRGRELLTNSGYLHYEISNYALPGRECRHNLKYWHNEEYIGFGPSAASFVEGRRFVNLPDNRLYAELLGSDRLPVFECEVLSPAAHRAETAILALRLLNEGIDRIRYRDRYGIDPLEEYADAVRKWLSLGMISLDEKKIVLTEVGALWANRIQESFLSEA